MRQVTIIGLAAVLVTLVGALPAVATVTDAILNSDLKGAVVIGADDGGEGGGGDGGEGGDGGGDGSGSGSAAGDGGAPAVTAASQPGASTPGQPLTEEQRARIVAEGNSCVGAQVASGAAVAGCFGSAPATNDAPAGQPAQPPVTVASVRQEAVDKITLTKPDLQASLCLANADSCKGTVGVPVWLWIGEGEGDLPSESASASAGRFSIQATATVSKVKWSLGDGQSTVCSGTGTKYVSDVHGWSSPHCGFESGWKQAGTYTLTASYVWDISWSGDQTGSTTQTMSSTQQVTVSELQSVVTSG